MHLYGTSEQVIPAKAGIRYLTDSGQTGPQLRGYEGLNQNAVKYYPPT